jgi:hypothetical protein
MILVGAAVYLFISSAFVMSLMLAAARPMPTPNDCTDVVQPKHSLESGAPCARIIS